MENICNLVASETSPAPSKISGCISSKYLLKRSVLSLALYSKQGKYVEAESLYKRSVAILEKTQTTNDPTNLATSLKNYAVLLRKTNREAEASKLEKQASALIRVK